MSATPTRPNQLRKRVLDDGADLRGVSIGEIDLVRDALIAYSSEDPSHPVDNLVDGHAGPAGTRWVGGRVDAPERIVIEFNQPQSVSRLIYEVEEREHERTQEVRAEASTDFGKTYWQVLVQEYTFSPGGATFEREDLRFSLEGVTHFRLDIVPNKRGSGAATLTSVRLFG